MSCGMWSASVKREVQGVKSAVWSVKKCSLDVALQRGRTPVTFLDSNSATSSRKASTHGARRVQVL